MISISCHFKFLIYDLPSTSRPIFSSSDYNSLDQSLSEQLIAANVDKTFRPSYQTEDSSIRHRIYESPVHVTACPCPQLDQSSPHIPFYFSTMHFNFIFSAIPAPSKWSVCFRFPHTSSVFSHTLLIRTTFPAYLILLYLITRNLCDAQQKLCSFSFCYLLHSALTREIRGLLEKYPTFGREKETGLLGALDT